MGCLVEGTRVGLPTMGSWEAYCRDCKTSGHRSHMTCYPFRGKVVQDHPPHTWDSGVGYGPYWCKGYGRTARQAKIEAHVDFGESVYDPPTETVVPAEEFDRLVEKLAEPAEVNPALARWIGEAAARRLMAEKAEQEANDLTEALAATKAQRDGFLNVWTLHEMAPRTRCRTCQFEMIDLPGKRPLCCNPQCVIYEGDGSHESTCPICKDA